MCVWKCVHNVWKHTNPFPSFIVIFLKPTKQKKAKKNFISNNNLLLAWSSLTASLSFLMQCYHPYNIITYLYLYMDVLPGHIGNKHSSGSRSQCSEPGKGQISTAEFHSRHTSHPQEIDAMQFYKRFCLVPDRAFIYIYIM